MWLVGVAGWMPPNVPTPSSPKLARSGSAVINRVAGPSPLSMSPLERLQPRPSVTPPLPDLSPMLLLPLVPLRGCPLSLPVRMLSALPLLLPLSPPLVQQPVLSPWSLLRLPLTLVLPLPVPVPVSMTVLVPLPLPLPVPWLRSLLLLPGLLLIPACSSRGCPTAVPGLASAGVGAGGGKKNRLAEWRAAATTEDASAKTRRPEFGAGVVAGSSRLITTGVGGECRLSSSGRRSVGGTTGEPTARAAAAGPRLVVRSDALMRCTAVRRRRPSPMSAIVNALRWPWR